MKARPFHIHDGKTGSALAVRVLPRSSRNEVVEVLKDGTVKIRLTSPPVDGKANQALIDFLADILHVSRSDIEIIAGHTGRNKLISIINMDANTMEQRILQVLQAK